MTNRGHQRNRGFHIFLKISNRGWSMGESCLLQIEALNKSQIFITDAFFQKLFFKNFITPNKIANFYADLI